MQTCRSKARMRAITAAMLQILRIRSLISCRRLSLGGTPVSFGSLRSSNQYPSRISNATMGIIPRTNAFTGTPESWQPNRIKAYVGIKLSEMWRK